MNHNFKMEVTDTFGGEANYCWVERETVSLPETVTDRGLVRKLKAFAGWTGLKCRVSNYGDAIEVRPYGMCQVGFIEFDGETTP